MNFNFHLQPIIDAARNIVDDVKDVYDTQYE